LTVVVGQNFACIGHIVSCVTNEMSMATSILPIMVVPVTLFGGYFLNSGFVITFTEFKIYTFFLLPASLVVSRFCRLSVCPSVCLSVSLMHRGSCTRELSYLEINN